MRKVPKKRCYRVTNTHSKKIMARCTSKVKAEKQMRLLRAILNNKKFVLRPRSRTSKKR